MLEVLNLTALEYLLVQLLEQRPHLLIAMAQGMLSSALLNMVLNLRQCNTQDASCTNIHMYTTDNLVGWVLGAERCSAPINTPALRPRVNSAHKYAQNMPTNTVLVHRHAP